MIMFKHVMMLFCKFMPKKEKRKKITSVKSHVV